jgi:thiol:disulfide interchange protein
MGGSFVKTRQRHIIVVLASVALFASVALAQKGGNHGPIPWMTSFDKAKKTAAKQKKPMLVDFSATWCPPCQEMKKTTWTDKAVVQRAQRFVPVLIDIDKERKRTDDAKVSAVPTVVFYSPSGRELLRAEGYRDPKAMLDLMAQAEKKAAGK